MRLLKACLLRFQQLGCREVLWQPRCETNGMLLRILDISEKVSFEHFFFRISAQWRKTIVESQIQLTLQQLRYSKRKVVENGRIERCSERLCSVNQLY